MDKIHFYYHLYNVWHFYIYGVFKNETLKFVATMTAIILIDCTHQ